MVVPSTFARHDRDMTMYLISFPSEALVLNAEELPVVAEQAHAVIREAKDAGVLVFAGGIEERTDPVMVSSEGVVSPETYPGVKYTGGFTVLDLPSREDAVAWARKLSVACGCSQELREFAHDPEI